jgi:hypothetical protein
MPEGWLTFYNEERPHQALAYRTPREVFDGEVREAMDSAWWWLAAALPTGSQAGKKKEC